jgi:quercetin dioxygenase-like cupin family protein
MAEVPFVTPAESGQVEQLAGVYRRTMATTDRLMLCEFFLQRGAVIPEHSHEHDQVSYVVYGRLEVTIGNSVQVLEQGDSYGVSGGILHHARALIDTLAVDTFTPPRSEYPIEAP